MSASIAQTVVKRYGVDAVTQLLTVEQINQLRYEWAVWARPEQVAPESAWRVWLILAGRGFGKTRLGAEWVRSMAESGHAGRIALVAPTAADARDVMVEGESGILAICPPWNKPTYEPSKRRVTWPNGAMATVYTADEPERLRGPQHDAAWCDELAAWRYPDAWDMLQFGLRLGTDPLAVVTTTPKPKKLVRDLIKASTTVVTRGSTYDNAANLAEPFLEAIRAKYEGTRLGRQELYAEVLDDVPGALWTRALLDDGRLEAMPCDAHRIVVAVDPSGGHTEDNDEQGIVVAALGVDGKGYVLADLTCKLTPDGWGARAVEAFRDWKADRIVYEKNYGGEMVEHVLLTAAKSRDIHIATREVVATRGKVVRAEPIAALYEQKRIHHVGAFDLLEDEMCTFAPLTFDGSPNRVDALVWAFTELMVHDTVELGSGPIAGGVRRVDEKAPARGRHTRTWDTDEDDEKSRSTM